MGVLIVLIHVVGGVTLLVIDNVLITAIIDALALVVDLVQHF